MLRREQLVKTLICPVSTLRVDHSVVRVTAFLVATLVALYAITGSIVIMALLAVDFYIRAFTAAAYSPASWVAIQIAQALGWTGTKIDKAPKIFAARVGFAFSVAAVLLYPISPVLSLVVSLVLMTFAILEAAFDFCAGCLVYARIVLPLFGERG
jgi:hypothetical protein